MAHLLLEDGEHALTRHVAEVANNAFLPDIAVDALSAWIESSGLDADELAWIQPTYGPDPCDEACVVCAEPAPGAYVFDGRVMEPEPAADGGRRMARDVWVASTGEKWIAEARLRKVVAGQPELSTALPGEAGRPTWYASWGVGETTWFAGDQGAIRRQGADAYFVVPSAPAAEPYSRNVFFSSVGGTSERDVWLAGGAGAVHWDGAKLERAEVCGKGDSRCVGRVAAVEGAVFFAGTSLVERRGESCTRYTLDDLHVTALAAASPTNAVAMVATPPKPISYGSSPSGVIHWNGARWLVLKVPEMADVVSAGEGRIRLVTQHGACARYAPDATCLAARARACAAKGRAHHPSAPIVAPLAAGRYPCPLVAIESTTMKLAPLAPLAPLEELATEATDAGDAGDAAAISTPHPDGARASWGLAALGLGLGLGSVGLGVGVVLRRRARAD